MNSSHSIIPKYYVTRPELRKIVGWVERSETQQRIDNVGFRPSTQPTPIALSDTADNYLAVEDE